MNSYYTTYCRLKNEHHQQCMFNDKKGTVGDNFEISFNDNGDLLGTFYCYNSFQGYDGMMHGGMIAALIDSAMAKCLMGHGVVGYTGRMNIRYRKPVKSQQQLGIRCSITERYKELYKVKAAITQESGRGSHVTAQARFYKVN
ncbi:MAG: hypothetical protein GF401_02285 [Chitinivibrionales bacterium]|nr:hypothetical protein [Chitinivibrionales bacterium]